MSDRDKLVARSTCGESGDSPRRQPVQKLHVFKFEYSQMGVTSSVD